jgi:hypothetical protein
MKNHVDPLIEEAVIKFAAEQPAFGQAQTGVKCASSA